MAKYKLTIEDRPSRDDVLFLVDNLNTYNASKVSNEGQLIAIFLREKYHRIIGGLYGWTAFGWLHVDILWVREDVRGRGYGKKILTAAEQEGVKRGCRHAALDTFSFQSPEFYLRLGYIVFGELDDVGTNHKWYFLKKDLI